MLAEPEGIRGLDRNHLHAKGSPLLPAIQHQALAETCFNIHPVASRMTILGVDQVSVAVDSLDDATRIYERLLGLKATHDETVPDQGVTTRFFPVGASDTVVEALLPTGPETPVGKFLAKRGPGVHHIAFRTDDLDAELTRLKRLGVRLIDERPRLGAEGKRIAFIHPKETGGVLIELCELPTGHGKGHGKGHA